MIGSFLRHRPATVLWPSGLWRTASSRRSGWRGPAVTGRVGSVPAHVGLSVVEVDRSDRQSRRAHGKSDPLDAYAAARAVVSGLAAVVPKLRDGRVEAIRALRVARSSAVKARTQATNQIKALIVTGPSELREQLRHLRTPKIVSVCARLRPGNNLGDPEQATKTALRRLAKRHQQLSEEISEADHEIAQLVGEVAPELLSLLGVGPEVAGQLLTSAGDNPDRITSEAAFAHLCGVRPGPGQQRPRSSAPTQPGWRPPRQQRPLHHRAQPTPLRPQKPRLRRTPHPGRTLEIGDHPVFEALRRPRDLQRPCPGPISRTSPASTCQCIGASA